MIITQRSYAGTLESSDLLVEVWPSEGDSLEIDITSSVEKQFSEQITKVVEETLSEMGVQSACVTIDDKGALDCVIRARLQAAVMRAANTEQMPWRNIK
ncbi:citrate lyase acyl carrier protein [Vibrio sp. SCSIO 43137]|uniref:citrate lyase acyl carrier protein n=1 Tax=Vibrio sp. SCSIO 43137 TaxID=3021011 RepID=UPI002307EB7A|nr:citrate lyase acyl carrier protein [Vibrio sp. SCSIO 43137]WCE31375.1 citrate lyase acyl carrier protein [Vibrio sp. SCSIO 43137]